MTLRHSHVYLSLGLCALLLLLGLCLWASLTLGAKPIPLAALWRHFSPEHVPNYDDLVINTRKARTLAAVLVGVALALSGTLIQGVLRNPLGDPGLLGIHAGASAVIVTAAMVPALAALPTFWPALLGAVLAMMFFYALGAARGQTHPAHLVLVGAALNACLFAYSQAIVVLNPDVLDHYRYWVIGALTQLTTAQLYGYLPYFGVALCLSILVAPALNVMIFQERTAASLGVNVGHIRLWALLAALMLAALATAIAGPIGFIGLATPHLARVVCRNDFRWLLPYCLLLGPILLLLSDIAARLLLAPAELLVGTLTAFIGGPLLYVLAKRKMGVAYGPH